MPISAASVWWMRRDKLTKIIPQGPSGCPSAESKKHESIHQKENVGRRLERERETETEREETSIAIGAVEVPYLSMTFPSLSTRNLVKFHLILDDPNKPGLLAFRNL